MGQLISDVVFGACFVQLGEVNAHTSLPTCFLNHDYIGQPLGVEYFSDEVCLSSL